MRLTVQSIGLLLFVFLFSLSFTGKVLAADFKITGTAIDGNNNPIVNAKVTATDVTTQKIVATVLSDQSGYYVLLVPKGTYTIVTSPPDGSGLQPITEPNILVSSDITLHNNISKGGPVPTSPKANPFGKFFGWILLGALLLAVVAGVGVALFQQKKK